MTAPTACLIIIGNEILSGRTPDENLNWLAKKLGAMGINMTEARVIPDVEQTIINTVSTCRAAHDYVFTTGGIGSTHDDITTACIAKSFAVPVVRTEGAVSILKAHYTESHLNEARLSMADMPKGAYFNKTLAYRMGNVFVLAGVPSIMRMMFEDLQHRLQGGDITLSRSISLYISEGSIAEDVASIDAQFPNVEIGSYPTVKDGNPVTSLVLRCTDEALLEQAFSVVQEFAATTNAEIIT